MFEKSNSYNARQSKQKSLVELMISGGRVLQGEIFLAQGERLVDLLNDQRGFLPVETGEGEVRSIAKTAIIEARLIADAPAEKRKDPWKVLRIQPGAPIQEVRDAWRKRLKACHPDRFASFDADETIEYAAKRACQRINAAYDEIVQEMRHFAAKAKEEDAA